MSVKALGTSLKLTFEGKNQLIYPETWFFMLVVAICVIMQMNYLNKVCYLMSQNCHAGLVCRTHTFINDLLVVVQTFDKFLSWNIIPSPYNMLIYKEKLSLFVLYL